jgi:hypothetical protein
MNRRDLLKLTAALPVVATGQGWKPVLLTPEQDAIVVVVSDLIIPTTDTPGAKQANVNRYVDALLKEAPAQQRDRFLDGLKTLDESAKTKHGKGFVQIPAADQTAMLKELDERNDPFFRMMKGLTSRIYYQTQIGHRELNKDGRVPATFGCQHADHHGG